MPPEQITVSAFALAAYPTEHEVALAAPVFISDECPTQQASMTEEEVRKPFNDQPDLKKIDPQ